MPRQHPGRFNAPLHRSAPVILIVVRASDRQVSASPATFFQRHDSIRLTNSQAVEKLEKMERCSLIQHILDFCQRGQNVQKGTSRKAAVALTSGAREGVCEHDKEPRTPLADFFNILLMAHTHALTPLAIRNQQGMSLIAIVGLLSFITIGLSMFSGTIVRVWDRQQQEIEDRELVTIADGIMTYVHQNKSFPPNLAALTPDYAPYSTPHISQNARGFPRYLAYHPILAGFQNSTGIQAGNLPDARFLLISHLGQDADISIATPADFESWWTTDESTTPNLKIYRGHLAKYFFSLSLNPQGTGGSVYIHNQAFNSNGGLLPTQTRFHLEGTTVGFDEDNTYVNPEIIFGLTTNTTYWFNPTCSAAKRWNPLDPGC